MRITLYEKAQLDPAGIPAILAKYRRGLQFKADQEPKFLLTPVGEHSGSSDGFSEGTGKTGGVKNPYFVIFVCFSLPFRQKKFILV